MSTVSLDRLDFLSDTREASYILKERVLLVYSVGSLSHWGLDTLLGDQVL